MLQTLKTQRAEKLRAAEALKAADGTFATDAIRADFDAKMTEIESLDAQIRALEATPPMPASTEAARAAATTAERERVTGIHALCRAHKMDQAFADGLVAQGVTLDAARAQVLAKLAAASEQPPTRSTGGIVMGEDAHDKFLRGATNWLLVKGGVASLVARATKVDESTIDPGEYRGFTLLDLARFALERAGRSVIGLDKMRVVSEAFLLRATQSTSDFTTLLENVLHKTLLAAYAVQPDTWRLFCAESTVSDFRAHPRYRLGSFGALDTVTEDGEFKNKSITDAEKNTITAATKGNIINVSRQMIINDDMGAFARLSSMLGRAAALSIEVDVYALLAQNSGLGPTMGDGIVLFNASHNNIPTGAALSAAALDLDRVAMASQRDKDGNDYIDLRPAVLLVPVSLGGQARIINQSQYDPDTLANKSQMKPNIVAGLFRTVVDTPRITGTRRYLFADPSIAPTLEVAFLEGQSAPVLETQDGWRTDGAEMKVRLDYGVAAVDFRGAITNAGV